MIGDYPHKKNVRIAILVYVLFLGTLYLMTSCTSTKINRTKTKKEAVTELATKTETTEKTTEAARKQINFFDRSLINEEDFSVTLTPIDPLKPIEWLTNPKTGAQEAQNLIIEYERKTKNTTTNKAEETTEAAQAQTEAKATATTEATAKATEDETAKQKTKFSLPWYSWFFMGFFALCTIIWFTLYFSISKKIKAFKATKDVI